MKDIKPILLLFIFLFSLSLTAQKRMKRPDQDKMKAYKIAYITDQLNLTVEEAEKFWPIYNEISEKIERFRRKSRHDILKEVKEAGGTNNISNVKASMIVKKNLTMQKTVLIYEQELVEKLQKFLPARKILKLQISEKEFKKELFKRLNNQRKKFRKK